MPRPAIFTLVPAGKATTGAVFARPGCGRSVSVVFKTTPTVWTPFRQNVVGPLWLLRRCLPLLQASRGTVVQVSAVVAEQPLPGMAAYSATKAALSVADAVLARELRRVGVPVLDVRPPHTNTGLHERPLHGSSPRLSEGLDTDAVARTIVDALAERNASNLLPRSSIQGPESKAAA